VSTDARRKRIKEFGNSPLYPCVCYQSGSEVWRIRAYFLKDNESICGVKKEKSRDQ
jgi:hypothetical protein